tara:strand:- start:1 stop:282 length:282 start_codon:yes stop_codon:yes gene_type:complete
LSFLRLPSLGVLRLLGQGIRPRRFHCRFLLDFVHLGLFSVADADEFVHLDLEGILKRGRSFRFRHVHAGCASVGRNLNPMGAWAASVCSKALM